MSTVVRPLVHVRVDAPKVATRSLHCLVCKGLISKGSQYWEQGSTNEKGEIDYVVFLHPACLLLQQASAASRAR